MIKKVLFRNQVREYLISKMQTGDLQDGQLLSLAGIARELGVSVTPIREALTQLEQSNIVVGIPNRGFGIPKLDNKEAKNVYELIAALESLAITNASITTSLLKKIRTKEERFKNATEGLERINADMEFHQVLVSAYANPIALQIIKDLKVRIFFYEKKFMDVSDHQQSIRDHEQICTALETGNQSLAAEIVQKNWLQIFSHINL